MERVLHGQEALIQLKHTIKAEGVCEHSYDTGEQKCVIGHLLNIIDPDILKLVSSKYKLWKISKVMAVMFEEHRDTYMKIVGLGISVGDLIKLQSANDIYGQDGIEKIVKIINNMIKSWSSVDTKVIEEVYQSSEYVRKKMEEHLFYPSKGEEPCQND